MSELKPESKGRWKFNLPSCSTAFPKKSVALLAHAPPTTSGSNVVRHSTCLGLYNLEFWIANLAQVCRCLTVWSVPRVRVCLCSACLYAIVCSSVDAGRSVAAFESPVFHLHASTASVLGWSNEFDENEEGLQPSVEWNIDEAMGHPSRAS